MEDLKKNKRDCCLQGRNCRERGGYCELFKVYIYVKTDTDTCAYICTIDLESFHKYRTRFKMGT